MADHSKFDGLPIEFYEGKFSGAFEIENELGEKIAYDDVVTFLVVGVADKAGISANKSGELKRTNTFKTTNVMVLPQDQAVAVYNMVVDGEVPSHDTSAWDEAVVEADDLGFTIEYDDDDNDAEILLADTPSSDPALDSFLWEPQV